jgi:hypothetical protein
MNRSRIEAALGWRTLYITLISRMQGKYMIPDFRRLALVAIALCVCLAAPLVAQEKPAETGPFVIRAVDFNVIGRTLEFVLLAKADIKPGKSFETLAALEEFIADKRQTLLNERVLETVAAEYTLSASPGGGYDVAIRFTTTETWTIIALPKFQFDSNSGWQLSVRGRDYNFLGSMQALSLNLNYEIDESLRHGFGLSTSFTLPFQALEHDWALGLSDSFIVYSDGLTPLTSTTSASLSVTFRELGFPVTVSAGQSLNFNPEGITYDPDLYYLGSSFSVGASIPTGFKVKGLGEMYYNPSLGISYNWNLADDLGYTDRDGATPSASQSLSLGRVDWKGNQREGASFSLTNSNSLHTKKEVFTSYVDATARFHANWKELIGVSARVQAYYRLTGSERTDQGGSLRGILDARFDGDAALMANFDMPVKLFDFPTHVFIRKDWLDFELQANPFLDFGVSRRLGSTVGPDDLWYAGGLEFLVFPVRMRSFIVRASIGFDLQAVIANKSLTAPSPRDGSSPYEIFFGIGSHY